MPSLKPKPADPKAVSRGGKKGGYTPESREKSVVFWIAFFAVLATCLPYGLGFAITPASTHFAGYPYNIDDHYVYLSWIKQASDGQFFIKNLFTTDSQKVLLFNLLFLAIGFTARILHISLLAANEIFRLLGAIALLTLTYHFFKLCLPRDRLARIAAFAFVCLGSGFGWVRWSQWHDVNRPGGPIDAFQPEAYTFTSIYLFVLFSVGSCLILGTLYSMLRCAQTGRTRYAVYAGICALLVGNIHSYDIFHICAAWGLFMIAFTIVHRGRGAGRLWLQSLLALGMSMPSVLYTFYVYKHNSVFNARAHSDTRSLPIWNYALGYGIEFLLAAAALVALALWLAKARPARAESAQEVPDDASPPGWRDRTTALFVACWAVAGLAVIYIPFMFQRKALMGEHLPLCLLAGWGASVLLRNMRPAMRIAAAALLVAASAPSNALFLLRDMNHLQLNKSETFERPYLTQGQWDAFQYIGGNTPKDAAILADPFLALYIPALTGHPVWSGHWSETPDFPAKVSEFGKFARIPNTDMSRGYLTPDPSPQKEFLAETNCRYLLYPVDAAALHFQDFAASPPAYLVPVYRNKEYVVFEIDLSRR